MKKILHFKKGVHDFSYDVNDLAAFINAPETMPTVTNVLADSSIFGRIMVMDNVKSSMPIPAFTTDAELQEITGCSLSPSGTTKISDEVLTVKPIGTSEEYCNEELVGKW